MKREFLLIILAISLAGYAHFAAMPVQAAEFSLSVRPYEGGYDLRYGKVDLSLGRLNKEVVVDINSDLGKQYQLVQAMIEPLSTADGKRLRPRNFVVYGLRRNRYGNLHVEQEVTVSQGRQLIYTSNTAGNSDSFILGYGLIVTPDSEPGSYSGRISFTLTPIGSTQDPVTVVLNIIAEIEVKSAIEIQTSQGTKTIVLKAEKEEERSCDVTINIRGNMGSQFSILQVVNPQPASSEGKLLDWEAVKYIGAGAQKGMVVTVATPISGQPKTVYTSAISPEPDSFTLSYNIGNMTLQGEGLYRSRIQYLLEGGAMQTRLIDTLNLEIENPRVFDLAITPEVGGAIRFGDLRPNQPPKIQEVLFEIKSNIAKPYQVTQKMSSLLKDEEGKSIAQEYFTLREQEIGTKGTLKCPKKVPASPGDTVLFLSDKKGSPDAFKVIYELAAPQDVQHGEYKTFFTYSISEI